MIKRIREKSMFIAVGLVAVLLAVLLGGRLLNPPLVHAFDLPADFENVQVLNSLRDPDGFAFSPDGRMFISERVTGKLRVARYDANSDSWELNPEPFYTFNTPKDTNGDPQARRSAGLRDIAFDPNFASNGFVYAFYMSNDTLQNRVVRIKASAGNPDVADGAFGEELLIELPFNATASSGSHNGGAVEFGSDGKLYITTGDGWTGDFEGDPVQSLSTFTGKVLRIDADGTIPTDNPFYNQASGSYRAIYALGLRNPYSMSAHPTNGKLYINEARGDKKDSIYIVEAGANYGHEGSGIGTLRQPWAYGAGAGSELITGGAWYPAGGPFPATYHGSYFVALWGSNNASRGQISTIRSDSDTTVSAFERNVGLDVPGGPPVKPVVTRIGPDGNLYYMLTTYETGGGTIQMVRYTDQETVGTPTFTPPGGSFTDPVEVSMSTATAGATIHYTLDGSQPTQTSPVYTDPIVVSSSTTIKAKAFLDGLNPSSVGSATFTIGDAGTNQPPIVDAGPDQTVTVGTVVTLNGGGSTDPDGNDDFLTDEQWTQLSGPAVTIVDATEEVAYFTPNEAGVYVFELEMSDGELYGSDQVTITAVAEGGSACRSGGVQALYTFHEGSGSVVHDVSGVSPALDLTISGSGASWLADGGLSLNGAAQVASSGAATKIIDASRASNALSVEVWITPANVTQSGPARIVTLSGSSTERNFTLGQGKYGSTPPDVFDARLRTTDGSNNANGEPSLTTPAGAASAALSHVVYTRGATGDSAIYVNGESAASSKVGGTFDNWNGSYRLGLGNEFNSDRPWLGTLHRVAVYDCMLDADEVKAAHAAGPSPEPVTPTPPPIITPTPPPTEPTATPVPTATPLTQPTPQSGTITGQVFIDENGNGTYDPGEAVLANIIVILIDVGTEGQTTTITAVTDAQGVYRFVNVPPANYLISFALPPGYAPISAAELSVETEGANVQAPDYGVTEQTLQNGVYLPLITQ